MAECRELGITASFVGLQPGFDALFIQKLFHPLGASVLRIAMQGLVELSVEIILALIPGEFAAAFEANLRGTQHDRIFLCERVCQDRGFLAQTFERNCPVDQAHGSSLNAGERGPGHNVFECLAMAHRIGHGLADKVSRRNAQLISESPNTAVSAAIARAHATRGEKAPPKHQPLTIAIVGFGYGASKRHCHSAFVR